MKLLIVGLGSMGKRRARLAKGMDAAIEVVGVDSAEVRRAEAKNLGLVTDAWASIGEAVAAARPDAALVCTSPLSHAAIIGELLDHDLPVFTELNLVRDGYAENMAKAKEKHLPLFLSSTMLYRRETQYIKKAVQDFGKPVHYIYHIGQYLPDWHPWENYKNFFVGNVRTGGVREIFGIDLPWLLDAFGDVEKMMTEIPSATWACPTPTAPPCFCATRAAPRACWRRTWCPPRRCATLSASAMGCTCSGRATPRRCMSSGTATSSRWTPTPALSMTAATATTSWRTPMWTSWPTSSVC